MTLKPFKARAGFDAHGQRGINFDRPVDDLDVANKLWTEEQIAAQSRLQGTYIPDSNGEELPSPDLDALVPGVDVLTADYWITGLNGRPDSGPFAFVELNADDRLIANVSTGGVQTLTLNPAAPTGLLPNQVYRVEVVDPAYAGDGAAFAITLFVDATGTVFASALSNNGYGYQAGEVLNTVIPNSFVNAIAPAPTINATPVILSPDTTYYDAVITGGTGAGVRANFRTNATGTLIDEVFILSRGNGYTVGDSLAVSIEGQNAGTIDVTAVYSGNDIPLTVTIDTVGLDVGWDLIRGPGLTRAQADLDYLRRDGGNSPTRDISWNNQNLTDLADPVGAQDAVNLRTLTNGVQAVRQTITQVGHGFAVGQPVYFNSGTSLWALAQANDADTLKWAVVESILDNDTFRVAYYGVIAWGGHGLNVGEVYYLSDTVAGGLIATPPTTTATFAQGVVQVLSADSVKVIDMIASAGGGITALDAEISGAADGQLVRYSSATGKWVNFNPQLNIVNGIGLGGLTENAILRWEAATQKWNAVPLKIGTVGDVLGTPADGDILVYNGATSAWEMQAATALTPPDVPVVIHGGDAQTTQSTVALPFSPSKKIRLTGWITTLGTHYNRPQVIGQINGQWVDWGQHRTSDSGHFIAWYGNGGINGELSAMCGNSDNSGFLFTRASAGDYAPGSSVGHVVIDLDIHSSNWFQISCQLIYRSANGTRIKSQAVCTYSYPDSNRFTMIGLKNSAGPTNFSYNVEVV